MVVLKKVFKVLNDITFFTILISCSIRTWLQRKGGHNANYVCIDFCWGREHNAKILNYTSKKGI